MKINYLYLLILYMSISLKLSAFFVFPPPSFAEEPQDTWFFNLSSFSSSNLSCVANQHPVSVSYQWMYETEIVSKFTNFTHIQVEKYGAYVCLLSNSFGTVRSRTALVKKPVIKYQEITDFHKNIINGGYLFLPSLEVYESVPQITEVFWRKKTKFQEWEILQKDLYTKNGSLLIRSINSEEHNTSFSYIIKQKNDYLIVGYTVTVNITNNTISPNLRQCENRSLVLVELSPHVIVYAGENISMECLAFFYYCSFPPAISWYYPNVTNEISKFKPIYNIFNSRLSDSGNYTCKVRASNYKLQTIVTVLVIPYPPSFAEEPQDTWFFNSPSISSANLSCVANHHPVTVSVQWMYETEIVSKFTNITHIQVDKYGAYTCFLSNSFGIVRSRTAQVKKPVIDYQEIKDFHTNIINGSYLFLPSLKVYESVPPVAEIFWRKKTKSEKWEVLQKDLYTKNGSLLIRSVNSEEHNTSFSYIIKQKNNHSVVGYTVTVNITKVSLNSKQCVNSGLTLIEVPAHVTAYAGENISIECLGVYYYCSFPPAITWYYNYSSVKNEIPKAKAVLHISNSRLSDSGNYICEVRGFDYKLQTNVTVLEKPSLNITSESVTIYIKDGAPITLDKIALTSTVGLKSFEWYFNGKNLSRNSKYNYTSDYKLIVNQPVESDSGIYQVFYFFDGFELKHSFNAFFVNDKFVTVTKLLTSTLTLSSRVLTTNFKTLSHSTDAVKVSIFSLNKSTCLIISSGHSVAINSSQSLAIILPSLVPKKELIKKGSLIISLSIGSAVLVIGLLIGLIMRKRCFIKKGTKKKEIKGMEMSEKKVFCATTSEAECGYVAIQPKPQSLYESYVLRNSSILNSKYISQENPYYE
ncbi:cell adhesion molecule DSCAML1 isoform X2 [Hydra vulgaris]|uniref:cell adhesion molecule DSCAML1 isoform X2 n=1 Tax=Hydra vulgaris TaxID=6087 RepID=UPI0032EA3A1A